MRQRLSVQENLLVVVRVTKVSSRRDLNLEGDTAPHGSRTASVLFQNGAHLSKAAPRPVALLLVGRPLEISQLQHDDE